MGNGKTYVKINKNKHESRIYRFKSDEEKEDFLKSWYWHKDPLRIHASLSRFLYLLLLPIECIAYALEALAWCLSKVSGLIWIVIDTIKENQVVPEETKVNS